MIPVNNLPITEIDLLTQAQWYRREPYLLLFPLGILLAWAGVGHWLLFSLGMSHTFDPIFHAMTQVQGFLMAFAAGFLLTMIPRRTGTRPPATWEVAVGALSPLTTTIAAWYQQWHLAQAAWLVLALTLIAFAVERFTHASARRRPPNGFVWIPLAFASGIVGSLLTGAGAMVGGDWFWLHTVGRGLVLQGMFVGLVLGVGGLAFPLMTRGVAPADGCSTARDRRIMASHACGAAVLFLSFWLEAMGGLRAALSLRCAVVSLVLVYSTELWRLPDQAGLNRWLIWIAGWMLPTGYLLAAITPERATAGLHVVFIGGFALLALAVATQVTLGHRGYRSSMLGRPWPVAVTGLLIGVTLVARVAMQFDPTRYLPWMTLASGCFLLATGVWLLFLAPKMLWQNDTQ